MEMKKSIFLALACALFVPGVVNAASVDLILEYVGSFESDFSTPVGYSLNNPLLPGTVDPTDVHQFAIKFSAEGLPGDQSLSYFAVNTILGSGLTPAPFAGQAYFGNTTVSYDPPGPPPSGPLFLINEDLGVAGDLQEITVATNQPAAVGLNPGEAAPFYMGDFYVQFEGQSSATLQVVKRPGDVLLYWPGASGSEQEAVDYDISSASFAITVVPEPGAIVMLSMAAAGLALVRRRVRK